jgi:hypothetical protein
VVTPRPGSLPSCPSWCTTDHQGTVSRAHSCAVGRIQVGPADVRVALAWDQHGIRAFGTPSVVLTAYASPDLLQGRIRPVLILGAKDAGELATLLELLEHPEAADLLRQAAGLLAAEEGRSDDA